MELRSIKTSFTGINAAEPPCSGSTEHTELFQHGNRELAQQRWLAPEWNITRWYVLYTSANHEKRVADHLHLREVEHLLPLYASARKWKDRTVTLQMPLFPGYVFVKIQLRDRLRILQIPGVAKFVGFDGTPAPLPEEDMEALQGALGAGLPLAPHPFLKIGRSVRVKNGPMAGLQGILKRRKGAARLVVCVELIARAMAVEIDEADVEAVSGRE